MILDLEDGNIRARLTPIGPDRTRMRLTLDYPRAEPYRTKIRRWLDDFLSAQSDAAGATYSEPGTEVVLRGEVVAAGPRADVLSIDVEAAA